MQIENDYDKEVYNGDIGTINRVDPEVGEIAVTFDGRAVGYGFGELDMLVPAYAACDGIRLWRLQRDIKQHTRPTRWRTPYNRQVGL